jgi:MFS transporter, AAHS family, 4-hydroxybenzoate transporter
VLRELHPERGPVRTSYSRSIDGENALIPETDFVTPVDIPALIDRQTFGRFHLQVLLLCAATLFIDGFDVQSIAYVGPSVSKDWHLGPGALGPVFGAGVLGLMLGALVFGPLADRVGRRTVLISCVLLFGAGTLATAAAASMQGLLVIRFVAGLGLGGAMPTAIALVAEYSPSRLRARMVVVAFCGYSVGSASGGVVAANLIPAFGWHAVFYFGGFLTLLIAPILLVALPESLRVLSIMGGESERIVRILRRMNPELQFGEATCFVNHEEKLGGFPVLHLFREGRAPATILLWIIFFANLLDLFLMSHWLPTIINDVGFSLQTAVIATSLLQIGGTIGGLALGWLMDRLGAYRVLSIGYVTAAIFIVGIGLVGSSVWTLMVSVLGAGFCIMGGQIALNALAATFYPTPMRSTGLGWALGIGRVGSFVGPVAGGVMLSLQWSTLTIFLLGAIPALVAAGAVAGLARFRHLTSGHDEDQGPVSCGAAIETSRPIEASI